MVLHKTAGTRMKNLSGKPYLKGNPKRKILGLAVVRAESYNNSSLILVSGRVAQLSQGVGSPPWTVALPTYLRFIHVPHWHLVVAVSILRHGCLHIRPGSLHFEAWMPPALSRNTPFWEWAYGSSWWRYLEGASLCSGELWGYDNF